MICAVLSLGVSRAQAQCTSPESCVCQRLPTAHVLRGRIASLEGARATVDVHDVLANQTQFDVKPGATIAGQLDAVTPCQIPETGFAPGDEVLALWEGPTQARLLACQAYATCSAEQCDTPGARGALDKGCHQSCLEASSGECPNMLDQTRLVLLPWADSLNLGEGRELAAERAPYLGSSTGCYELFPAPPLQPCNDQILVPENEGCGVAGSRGASDATWLAFLLLWAARRMSGRSVPR